MSSPIIKEPATSSNSKVKVALLVVLFLCICCFSCSVGVSLLSSQIAKTDNSVATTQAVSPTVSLTEKPVQIYKIGETARSGDVELTVFAVADKVTSSNTFNKPNAGNKFVAVDIKVTYLGEGSDYVNQIEFALKDTSDYIYSASFMPIKVPDLKMQTIGKNESMRGWITFEITQNLDIKDLKLIYNSGYKKSEEVTFYLK